MHKLVTCRTIEIEALMERREPGTSSHGDTCCLCGRECGEMRIHVRDARNAHYPNNWDAQACTEGCAIILGRWLYAIHRMKEGFHTPLCVAHECTAVTLGITTMKTT